MRAASSSPQRQQLHCNTRIIHFTALTSHRKDHITRILTNYTSLARRSSHAYTAKSPQRPPPHRRPTDGLATSQTDSHDNLADHVTCAKKEDGREGGGLSNGRSRTVKSSSFSGGQQRFFLLPMLTHWPRSQALAPRRSAMSYSTWTQQGQYYHQ